MDLLFFKEYRTRLSDPNRPHNVYLTEEETTITGDDSVRNMPWNWKTLYEDEIQEKEMLDTFDQSNRMNQIRIIKCTICQPKERVFSKPQELMQLAKRIGARIARPTEEEIHQFHIRGRIPYGTERNTQRSSFDYWKITDFSIKELNSRRTTTRSLILHKNLYWMPRNHASQEALTRTYGKMDKVNILAGKQLCKITWPQLQNPSKTAIDLGAILYEDRDILPTSQDVEIYNIIARMHIEHATDEIISWKDYNDNHEKGQSMLLPEGPVPRYWYQLKAIKSWILSGNYMQHTFQRSKTHQLQWPIINPFDRLLEGLKAVVFGTTKTDKRICYPHVAIYNHYVTTWRASRRQHLPEDIHESWGPLQDQYDVAYILGMDRKKDFYNKQIKHEQELTSIIERKSREKTNKTRNR